MNQPLAFIHPEAKIAPDVIIEPFVYVDKNVEIGRGTHLMSGAKVLYGSRIGENCRIFAGAVIGGIPQDLKFQGEESLAIIGNNTTIRECATINRGTASKGKTVVGNNCLIMAYVHVGHDCAIGDSVIMSNAVQLAGEVIVHDYAIISGGTVVHQFSVIGSHAMVQGGSAVNKDVPPYVMALHIPVVFGGINSVGLRRRGFSNEKISEIQEIYRLLYRAGMNNTDAINHIESTMPQTPERDLIIAFVRSSERGIIKGSV